MTAVDTLVDVLARLGALNGETLFLNDEQLNEWPAETVEAMRAGKLLVKAAPAATVVCSGCEHHCVMPVHTVPDHPPSFVVCDKRNDINRVRVSPEQLRQWRCDATAVCAFIANSLGLRLSDRTPLDIDLLPIAVARSSSRRQMVSLRVNGGVAVVVGNTETPLEDLIRYHDGGYSVDAKTLYELVNASTTADPHYTPNTTRREQSKRETEAMYGRWNKAFRRLKKEQRAKGHPRRSDRWYGREIAKLPIAAGRDADTIRKRMK